MILEEDDTAGYRKNPDGIELGDVDGEPSTSAETRKPAKPMKPPVVAAMAIPEEEDDEELYMAPVINHACLKIGTKYLLQDIVRILCCLNNLAPTLKAATCKQLDTGSLIYSNVFC